MSQSTLNFTDNFDGLARNEDPETSKESAQGSREAQCRAYLEFIRSRGVLGATDDECIAALGIPSHGPRMSQLRKKGLVRWLGDHRKTRYDRNARVFVAAEFCVQVVKELGSEA